MAPAFSQVQMDDKQIISSELRKGKATAGLPALDAMKRYLKDRRDFQYLKSIGEVQSAETEKAALFRKDGELDPTNEKQIRSFGKTYTSEQVMAKLKRLNGRFVFERSVNFPDRMGIYIPHKDGTHRGNLLFIMGMGAKVITQASVRKPDLTGKRMMIEQRGWMKIIFDLARMGYINWPAAVRIFELRETTKNLSILTGAHK